MRPLATARAWMRSRSARVVAATGPWPAGRSLRALGALGAAAAVAAWAVTAHPRMSGMLEMPALFGIVALVVCLAQGRVRVLPVALVPLGVAVAVAIMSVEPPATTVAALGAALVAAHELGRWSLERRVDPPVEGWTERGRWLHLAVVLALGWIVGVGAVALAAGRVDIAVWQSALATVAAVAVVAAVALAAAARTR